MTAERRESIIGVEQPRQHLSLRVYLSGEARALLRIHPTYFPPADQIISYVRDHYFSGNRLRNLGTTLVDADGYQQLPTDRDLPHIVDTTSPPPVGKPITTPARRLAGSVGDRVGIGGGDIHFLFYVKGRQPGVIPLEDSSISTHLDLPADFWSEKSQLPSPTPPERARLKRIWQVCHDLRALWLVKRGQLLAMSPDCTMPWLFEYSETQNGAELAALTTFCDMSIWNQIVAKVLRPFQAPPNPHSLRPPRCGVLFFGPPGTGKTTVGKYLLERTGMSPIWFGTAPELSERYVGDTEQVIMNLFGVCKQRPHVLCAVMIDEIDTLTAKRDGGGGGGGNGRPDHKIDWLSVMLRIVGSKDFPNLVLIGSTNRRHAIDDAFVRTGRLDTRIFFGRLSAADRWRTFDSLAARCRLEIPQAVKDQLSTVIQRRTINFTGSLIRYVVDQFYRSCRAGHLNTDRVVATLNAAIDTVLRRHALEDPDLHFLYQHGVYTSDAPRDISLPAGDSGWCGQLLLQPNRSLLATFPGYLQALHPDLPNLSVRDVVLGSKVQSFVLLTAQHMRSWDEQSICEVIDEALADALRYSSNGTCLLIDLDSLVGIYERYHRPETTTSTQLSVQPADTLLRGVTHCTTRVCLAQPCRPFILHRLVQLCASLPKFTTLGSSCLVLIHSVSLSLVDLFAQAANWGQPLAPTGSITADGRYAFDLALVPPIQTAGFNHFVDRLEKVRVGVAADGRKWVLDAEGKMYCGAANNNTPPIELRFAKTLSNVPGAQTTVIVEKHGPHATLSYAINNCYAGVLFSGIPAGADNGVEPLLLKRSTRPQRTSVLQRVPLAAAPFWNTSTCADKFFSPNGVTIVQLCATGPDYTVCACKPFSTWTIRFRTASQRTIYPIVGIADSANLATVAIGIDLRNSPITAVGTAKPEWTVTAPSIPILSQAPYVRKVNEHSYVTYAFSEQLASEFQPISCTLRMMPVSFHISISLHTGVISCTIPITPARYYPAIVTRRQGAAFNVTDFN